MKTSEVPRPAVPYRSRQGVIFGVCRGLADHFEVPVLGVRLLWVVAFVFTSFWPAGIAYLALGMIMKPQPMLPPKDFEEAEFYSSYATSRQLALMRLKKSFDNLDRRIQRIEAIVTDKEFEWERRLGDTGAAGE